MGYLSSPMKTATMLICLIVSAFSAWAESPAELVAQGNSFFDAGRFDEAIAAYDQASVDLPESAEIYFNKGAALYRKGDLSAAVDAFENAALKSKDTRLTSRAKFNLGNCAFSEMERQRDSDLNKALEACERSIRHYQQALELDETFTEAAENIEIARLVMKTILDEIKKQQEQAQQQQQAQQQMKEELEQLIEEQKQAIENNQSLTNQEKEQGQSPDLDRKTQNLAEDQRDLQERTQNLAQQMAQQNQAQQQPQQSSPMEEIRQHVERAGDDQQSAAEKLDQKQLDPARGDQQSALENLEKARNEMDQQQQQQQQQGQSEQQQQQEQQQQEQQQQPETQQEQVAQLTDEARDILEEEKENREARRVPASGYKSVDKDW